MQLFDGLTLPRFTVVVSCKCECSSLMSDSLPAEAGCGTC